MTKDIHHFIKLKQVDQRDLLLWKYDGALYEFSVRNAWHAVHNKGIEVDWSHLVWSQYAIPKHVTHLWLVTRRRLLTQDRLRQWHVGDNVDVSLLRCLLCKDVPDSHEHLFFECSFSNQMWNKVLNMAGLSIVSSKWSDIMACLLPISKQNKVNTIVGRLVVVASSCFVWHERNNILHGKGGRQPDEVANNIVDMVHLKLSSIRFKKSARVEQMKRTWKIVMEAG